MWLPARTIFNSGRLVVTASCAGAPVPARCSSRLLSSDTPNTLVECSTPSGVTGILTTKLEYAKQQLMCAQRLPASQEYSRRSRRTSCGTSRRCSTPSGVTGILTRGTGRGGGAFSKVLNAFRRHRNTHRGHGEGAWIGKFVLNAFRRHRNTHICGYANGGGCVCCPQRLPASQEYSQTPEIRFKISSLCSTPSGVTGILTLPDLTNSTNGKRAQRLPASQEYSRSTPSAERTMSSCAQRLPASQEYSRHADRLAARLAAVLNAFRRHRNTHPARSVQSIRTCRNPFRGT
jgi:hypothetical protein